MAAQAVDPRASPPLAPVTRLLHGAICDAMPTLDEDREIGPDVNRTVAPVRQAVDPAAEAFDLGTTPIRGAA